MDKQKQASVAGALDGVDVLDFTHALSGPLCTAILADFGARVIKVEKPGIGDATRYMSMKEEKVPDPVQGSTSFLCVNKNKEGIVLDLSKPEGRQIARDLAAKCDVVVENFRPGVMKRLGLCYEDLQQVNPSLIYCDISAYSYGPLAQEPGYDLVVQARAGTIAITGEPGGRPLRPGVSVCDVSTGLIAANGVLLALYARSQTGKGQKVNVSLYDSTLFTLSQYITPVLYNNVDLEPMGAGHLQICPYQSFPTADGWIFVCCATDEFFRRLCNGLGLPELANDERFTSNPLRVKHKEELSSPLNEVFRTKCTKEWERILHELDIPSSPVVTPLNAFRQALEFGSPMVELVQHPYYGTVHMPGRAIVLSETPGKTKRYPPRLGEDTHSVLREFLDFDMDSLTRLERDGIISQYREQA